MRHLGFVIKNEGFRAWFTICQIWAAGWLFYCDGIMGLFTWFFTCRTDYVVHVMMLYQRSTSTRVEPAHTISCKQSLQVNTRYCLRFTLVSVPNDKICRKKKNVCHASLGPICGMCWTSKFSPWRTEVLPFQFAGPQGSAAKVVVPDTTALV